MAEISSRKSGLGRRSFLRGGLLAGAGVLAVGTAVSSLDGVAQAAAGTQDNWHWCDSCAQLFHANNQIACGVCPYLSRGQQGSDLMPPHSVGSPTIYTLYHDESFGSPWQAGWRSCGQCSTLFY